jgi:hypothetical protein
MSPSDILQTGKINSLYREREIGRGYQSQQTVLASLIASDMVSLFYHIAPWQA